MDLILDLSCHVRERLAIALESGILPERPSKAALRTVLDPGTPEEPVLEALKILEEMGATGPNAAKWIRTISKIEARMPQVDLVWSGPEVSGLHARDTRQVHDELIGNAERSLWLSTYVFFDGPRAFARLAQRMDEVPGLRVTMLLNIQRRRGDITAADDLVRRFADRLWRNEWPGVARPDVFYDPRALDPIEPSGVLHAKAIVADEEAVLVTSANLTDAGLERNIELGLLARDRALAKSIIAHFRGLIERGMLHPLPAD